MFKPRLSVNINKYALLRNSRGHGKPDLLGAANVCLLAGAHGITVHPRRDQRHVRYDDLVPLRSWLAEAWPGTELNIECEDHPEIIDQVLALRPAQCTLVPVTPGEVTSDHGWDLPRDAAGLAPTVARLKAAGIRVSCFADCEPERIAAFAAIGADRVELYTGPFADAWGTADEAVQTELALASGQAAAEAGLGLNAGHDLDSANLAGLRPMTNLDEVSIGHAQICRALEVGTTRSVRELLTALGWA